MKTYPNIPDMFPNVRKFAMTSMLVLGVAVMTSPAQADNPMSKADGSWVTFSGTVAQSNANGFFIDYGHSTVFVEVDDWDWYAEGYTALPGDEVTVSGRVDKLGFENRTLEAAYVYSHETHTYHYANPADEEGYGEGLGYVVHPYGSMPSTATMSVVGTIDKVKGDEFTLATGYANITVETEAMAYDPLDDIGYQKLEQGDIVSVTGVMAAGSLDDFYDSRELIASSVLTLVPHETRTDDS